MKNFDDDLRMLCMRNLERIPQFQSRRRLQSVVGETQFPLLRMLPICTLLDIGTFVGIQGIPNPISHQNLFLGQVVQQQIFVDLHLRANSRTTIFARRGTLD